MKVLLVSPNSRDALLQAVLERQAYLKRLGILFIGSFTLLGGPIAYQTFDPYKQVRSGCEVGCPLARLETLGC